MPNRKSSSLVDSAAGEGFQGALASRAWEGHLVLWLAAKLLARLALVLFVRLFRFGCGSIVDVHIYADTVSP